MTRRSLLVALAVLAPMLAQAQVLAILEGARTELVEPTPTPRDPLARDLRGGRPMRGFGAQRLVHFTFDDGPRPGVTDRVLDELDRRGARATFFVVGRQLERPRQRALLEEMVRRGHTVGAHGYDHTDLRTLSVSALHQQLDRTEALFVEILGDRPYLFRPPYGGRNAQVDAVLAEREYATVLWNVTAADAHARDASEVLAAFRESLDGQERHRSGPGSVVLLHDTHPWVADALPLLFDELDRRNCALVAHEDEALWDVADDLRPFFRPRGARAPVGMDHATFATRQLALRERARERCAEGSSESM
jgi:peptidoglycan/xylan/chitin deacetylase (PgdA/CDA1 family)